MKNNALVIISLAFMTFAACEESNQEEDTPLEHKAELLIHQIEEGDLEILTVDGCEYIAFKDGRGTNHGFGYLAHKGNCKNSIHCYNQNFKSDSLSIH